MVLVCASLALHKHFLDFRSGNDGSRAFQLSPVILAAAGIQSPDHAPRRLCQLRRAGWTGRRPSWTIPADPHQVGWEKGLWIPAAARMTGALDYPCAMDISRQLKRPWMTGETPLTLVSARDKLSAIRYARPEFSIFLHISVGKITCRRRQMALVGRGLPRAGSQRSHPPSMGR